MFVRDAGENTHRSRAAALGGLAQNPEESRRTENDGALLHRNSCPSGRSVPGNVGTVRLDGYLYASPLRQSNRLLGSGCDIIQPSCNDRDGRCGNRQFGRFDVKQFALSGCFSTVDVPVLKSFFRLALGRTTGSCQEQDAVGESTGLVPEVQRGDLVEHVRRTAESRNCQRPGLLVLSPPSDEAEKVLLTEKGSAARTGIPQHEGVNGFSVALCRSEGCSEPHPGDGDEIESQGARRIRWQLERRQRIRKC